MNQKQTKILRSTLPVTLTGTERKSAFRRLKRDFNDTPRNERAQFVNIRKKLAEGFKEAFAEKSSG